MNQGTGNNGNGIEVTRSGFIERYAPMIRGGYRADFSRDIRVNPAVYHYIISRDGSREILMFSQARTLEAARQQAREDIDTMIGSQRADSATEAS